MVINGKLIKGHGVASITLAKQIPLMCESFPDISVCHFGSINLELEVDLIVASYDFRSLPIEWEPNHKEVFDFLRVRLTPINHPPVRAWLYIPHDSFHRKKLNHHELITTKLNIDGISDFRIEIQRPCIELPYSNRRMIVVA